MDKITDKKLSQRVKEVIQAVEDANSLFEVNHVEKLSEENSYYRLRLGDYRIGIKLEEDFVTLIRCLHRKDIYKYFP